MTEIQDQITAARDRLDEIRYGPGASRKRLAASAMYADVGYAPSEPAALRVQSAAAEAARSLVPLPRDLRSRAIGSLVSLIAAVERDEDDADRATLKAIEAEIAQATAEAQARKDAEPSGAGAPGYDPDLRRQLMSLLELDESLVTPGVETTLASFASVVQQARLDMRENRAIRDAGATLAAQSRPMVGIPGTVGISEAPHRG